MIRSKKDCSKENILDKKYPTGYNVNEITIRETNIFKKWMKSLKDKSTRLIINARIRRLSLGNKGDAEPVGLGISELRIDYGPGYRVYYTQIKNEIVVLLCGGDKSSQSRDIKKAKQIASKLEVPK
jgi:putative addiction module killer protein